VVLRKTRLEGEANAQKCVDEEEEEVVTAGLVFKSIGYKSVRALSNTRYTKIQHYCDTIVTPL
jgi:hypothetical protein